MAERRPGTPHNVGETFRNIVTLGSTRRRRAILDEQPVRKIDRSNRRQANPQTVARVYDQSSREYEATHGISDHMEDFIALLPANASILDVGSGQGLNANSLTERGFRVTGVDISPEMVNLARSRYPNIDFSVKDMRRLDYPRDSFDAVHAAYSLIHVPKRDTNKVMKNFNRVLKSGGVLRLDLQEGKSEEVFSQAPFYPQERLFMNVMSHEEELSLLAKHGFSVVQEFQRPPEPGEHPFIKRTIFARKNDSPRSRNASSNQGLI